LATIEEIHTDMAVIGSGSGGQKAAIQAAKLGKRVIVVEREQELGGASLNSGTIPSKSLREAILDLTNFRQRSFYAKAAPHEVTLAELNYRLDQVLAAERAMLMRQLRKNGVQWLHGSATFLDPYTLELTDSDGQPWAHLRADQIVIATGSRPHHPPGIDFDGERVVDSTQLLSIHQLPKSLLVVGAGVIGSEYASFYAALGVQVTVVDQRSHMLPHLDSEIGIHLQGALQDLGLRFVGDRSWQRIFRSHDRAFVQLSDGMQLEADLVLCSVGRQGQVEGLNLDRIGIDPNARGYIPVNHQFQTIHPHIFAVGDVIGYPTLASTSMEQGRLAARHALHEPAPPFPQIYPHGIYTIPEISYCGATEQELIDQRVHYEVGRAYYYEIARGQIEGASSGMFKLLVHGETGELLGIHIIGRGATELIHIGQVAMIFNAHLDFFVETIFNYPTYAEGYRIAALNGLNKLRHHQLHMAK
jgi:NAD(P) transhydrogenase